MKSCSLINFYFSISSTIPSLSTSIFRSRVIFRPLFKLTINEFYTCYFFSINKYHPEHRLIYLCRRRINVSNVLVAVTIHPFLFTKTFPSNILLLVYNYINQTLLLRVQNEIIEKNYLSSRFTIFKLKFSYGNYDSSKNLHLVKTVQSLSTTSVVQKSSSR